MNFKTIKKYFEENRNDLPNTLDLGHIYYRNVKGSVDIHIHQIETEVKRQRDRGFKVEETILISTSINHLLKIHDGLQDPSKCNTPRTERKDVFKYISK